MTDTPKLKYGTHVITGMYVDDGKDVYYVAETRHDFGDYLVLKKVGSYDHEAKKWSYYLMDSESSVDVFYPDFMNQNKINISDFVLHYIDDREGLIRALRDQLEYLLDEDHRYTLDALLDIVESY